MLASVCVATYERAERLPRLFEALAAQTAPPGTFELVIADDGSRDNSPAVIAELSRHVPFEVRLLRLGTNGGAARARNAAWRSARGDRILFTDDDCEPSPGWVMSHLQAGHACDIVVGRTGPADGEEPDGPFARVLRVEDPRYFTTCNVSYRRADLEAVGGFDERFRYAAGEDTDLGLLLTERGATVAFSSEASVVHPIRPSSLLATLRQSSRWMDVALVVRKHPGVRRTLLHRRVFWKDTHPATVCALLGAGVAVAAPARLRALLVLAASVPWLRRRRDVAPAALPGTFLVDAVEVFTMVRGSLVHHAAIL